MELEVGQFVRTKDGTIGKIIAIDLAKPRQEKYPNHPSKRWWRNKILISCYKGWRTTQNIIKASYNITDLISRFDLVNGHLVICKMYENEKDIPTIVKCVGDYYFKEEDIKSVITHEQMEQMAYKVEE